VYNYVLKSVVFILVRLDEGFASGSGALIDKENRVIITNDHVVDGATDMAFFFPTYKDGKLVMSRTAFVEQMRKGKEEDIIKGKVLVADVKRDLALVQLERLPEGVEALPLAREQAVTGQIGHSVGNPGGSGALWVYTSGTVRALYHHRWANRGVDRKPVMRDCDIVETQSPTNPGDSGGPLVNERGELIGVTHGAHPTANLLSMFIDVTEARALVNETFRKENLTWRPAKRPLLAKRGSVGGGDVTSLIKDLESQDARTRARAAKGLGDLGPEAQLAIPGLLKAIKDNDALTRRAASDALAKIGPAAKADLPALAGALKDNNLEVQRYAAGAVGELGGDAESAVPELLELATSGDALLKQIVLRALGKTGGGARDKVIPVLSEALKDSQKDVRVAAAEGLTSLSTGQSSDLPIFTALLKNQQDVEIRIQGARGLAKLGREAKPALGDLIAAAKDSDKKVRKAVIEALGPFGPEARNALPIFSEALKDNDKELRRAGLQALAKMGAESKNSIPAIRDLLKDPELRKEALATLGKLGPVAKDAVPAMAELLKDPDKDLKLETMAVLAALGPDAAKAVPNLIVLFEDREITFRRRVAETLAKIGRPAITPLVTALADNDLYIRWGACDTLAEMGPAARTSAVINALSYVGGNDRYLEVRDAAKKAYAKVTAK
jgi:HEAT repeat protein